MLINKVKEALTLGLIASLLAAMCIAVPAAYADTASQSSTSVYQNYSFYSKILAYDKMLDGRTYVKSSKSASAKELGADARIYLASGTLKASSGAAYNPVGLSANKWWYRSLQIKSVAGVSYYSKGYVYLGYAHSLFYAPATSTVKHQN